MSPAEKSMLKQYSIYDFFINGALAKLYEPLTSSGELSGDQYGLSQSQISLRVTTDTQLFSQQIVVRLSHWSTRDSFRLQLCRLGERVIGEKVTWTAMRKADRDPLADELCFGFKKGVSVRILDVRQRKVFL